MVVARDLAAVRAGVNDLRITGIGRNVSALASAHRIPTRAIDASPGRTGNADRRVVLLRAINPVREAIVGDGVVELRRGLVGLRGPVGAAIDAHVGAAVIGLDHAVGITGIDPQSVIVSVGNANGVEGLAAVIGAVHPGVEHVHAVGRLRIGEDVGVIKRALTVLAIAVNQGPVVASVVGTKQSAFVVLDQRPDAISVVSHSHANASRGAVRQAVSGKTLPCAAAVGAAIQARARPAALHAPWRTPRLP